MALKRGVANGTEPPCHKCGHKFKAGEIKVERPGKSGRSWVHESCSPTKFKHHTSGTVGKGRRKKSRR